MYLDCLIEAMRRDLKNAQNVPDSVLARLIRIQEGAGEKFDDGWEGVRRNIFGMVIGVVETTLKAVPRTIDQLLRRPDKLEEARIAALDYSHTRDPKQFTKYVFEAMRFNPQNHVLFRLAMKPFKLAVGTNRETNLIPAPALIFAGTLGAMFDPEKFEHPEEFRLNRPDEDYLFFGYEHHRCLGERISRIQIPVLVKHVVTLNQLRRAPDGEGFNPLDLRPEHFWLEFNTS
jgi:cytochrome P450